MSMKENFSVINLDDNIITTDNGKPRVRKSTEVFGSTERKRLANITNMHRPRMSMLDEKSQFVPASTKEYIDKLKKENMTLMKLLADRNKIIELSGIELRKLRVSMQKLQQQNFQLAQSNSQMLAELTVDKDRLKLLQHELGCKNSLLVAKGLELKEKDETIHSQKVDEGVQMHNEELESSQASRDNIKPSNINRMQQSKSLGPSTVVQSKDNKRLRRQSARLKSQEPKPEDEVFEVEPNTLALGPLHNAGMKEDFSNSLNLTTEKQDKISDSKRIPVRRQSARSEEPKPAEDLVAVDSTGLASGPNYDDRMHEDVSTSSLSLEKMDKASHSRRLRRQSARLKSQEPKPEDDVFEVEPNTLALGPLHNDGMKEDFSNFSNLTTEKQDKTSYSKRIPVRRQSARSKSEEPKPTEDLFAVDSTGIVSGPNDDDQMHEDVSTSILSVEKNDKASDSKRHSVGRESARFKSEEPDPDKALLEINSNKNMQNEVSISTCSSVEKDSIEVKCEPSRESQDYGRPSIGRPSRHAVKKVNSYKEVPLNTKMRRIE